MRQFLLALPVAFPILAGLILLAVHHKKIKYSDRFLFCYVLGTVVINSIMIAIILTGSGDGDSKLVLFRLFADLKLMFQVDGLGKVFAGLIAVLWPLAVLYAMEYMKEDERKGIFFVWYILTYGVTTGIAFSGNLVTLYVFYEMLTLVTFPLVLFPLSQEAKRASNTYMFFSIGGAAFAFLSLVFVLGHSVNGTTEFVLGGFLDRALAAGNENLLLLMFIFGFWGFGVKTALFPCYAWLPKAAVAPTPVTALLHAVAVVKSGAFAIIRLIYFCYGTAFLRGTWAQWLVMGGALFTIAFGSTKALKEIHWKRRLAYSTISNLSYILFAATIMTPLGLAAALAHMVAHAFMKINAFFCAGAVMHESGKTYIHQLDGLGRRMPVVFTCFTVSSLSLMGVPLFAGFVSKWSIAEAALKGADNQMWLPVLGVGVILYSALMTGIYMLTVVIRAFFPQKNREQREMTAEIKDPNWMMLVPLCLFTAGILYMGLHGQPLLDFFLKVGGGTV